jgi:hypothetical protein
MTIHSPRGNDRRLNVLVGFAAFVALIVLVLLPILVPKMLSTASATTAIKSGNELTGCRAAYRAQVDDAASRLQTSRARLDVATSEGLTAVAADDATALVAAVAKSGKARAAVIADAENLSRTTDRYSDLIRLSRDHSSKFLEVCRKEEP